MTLRRVICRLIVKLCESFQLTRCTYMRARESAAQTSSGFEAAVANASGQRLRLRAGDDGARPSWRPDAPRRTLGHSHSLPALNPRRGTMHASERSPQRLRAAFEGLPRPSELATQAETYQSDILRCEVELLEVLETTARCAAM